MSENKQNKCQQCGCPVSSEDQYVLNGVTLCDDCYLEEKNPVQACNPLAVYSAKRFQESGGPDADANLTEQQKAIYSFVKSKGKVTPQELCSKFGLSQRQLENQVAILRHLELTKGKKEGNKIYIVPF
ncbi:MAG: ArsR family transcriptional regulator [Candidatus Bathyarchaeota archaeon]|nr:ArsR family transcriptional regulator [Candidatus Bathyarchaeum sp.]